MNRKLWETRRVSDLDVDVVLKYLPLFRFQNVAVISEYRIKLHFLTLRCHITALPVIVGHLGSRY